MIAPVVFLTVFLALAGPPGGDPPPAGDFAVTFEKVGGRGLVARCAVGPNVTVIQTPDGLVVVDTHLSPGTMEVFRDAIVKETGRNDFRYVVNTHGHWDHSSGNQVFGDAAIVGHVSTPGFMAVHRADNTRTLLAERGRVAQLGAGGDPADESLAIHRIILSDLENRYRSTPPTVTFEDRYELVPGPDGILLVWAGTLHTPTDILVYVAGDRTLFTGDLFSSPHNFSFMVGPLSDVPRLLEVLQYFLDRGVDVVVPGHGNTMTGDDLAALHSRLSQRWTEWAGRGSAAVYLRDLIDKRGVEVVALFAEAEDKTAFGELSQDEFYLLGNRYLDDGNTAAATAVFELTLELFPEDPMIWLRLGDACLAAGDTLSAVSAFDHVAALGPGRSQMYAEFMLKALAGE
jgi:glyoxylase-like metal-dependent hydrolase (beta-lactamase superfamily II)